MREIVHYTFPSNWEPLSPGHRVRWLGWGEADFMELRLFWPTDLPLTQAILDEARVDGYQYCIGSVGAMPAGCGAVWRYSDTAWEVAGIQTLPAYRGQGVAKSVVSFITSYILVNGRQATLTTAVDNIPMQKVAEAVGFVRR